MENDINLLHPVVREGAKWLLAELEMMSYRPRIVETLRTPERQLEMYKTGKSTLRFGMHNMGLAFDLVDRNFGYNKDFLQKAGDMWASIGGTWGGYWSSFHDATHFEYGAQTNNINDLIKLHNNGEVIKLTPMLIPKQHNQLTDNENKALSWAIKNGISDGTKPKEPATRIEVMRMIHNYNSKITTIIGDMDNDKTS